MKRCFGFLRGLGGIETLRLRGGKKGGKEGKEEEERGGGSGST